MLSASITGKFMRYFRLVLLVAGFFSLYSCENNVKDLPDQHNKRTTALEEGHDIVSYLSEGGKPKAKLTAPLMYRYEADSSYVEFPKTLHVDFYNDSLVKESQLDAHYGKYYESQNKVFLKDSVIIINVLKGDTLRTNELWWNQSTQKFYTDKPVHITQKDGTDIHGQHGMEAKQDLSDRTIFNATGRGPLPKDSDSTPQPPKGGEGTPALNEKSGQ